MADRTIDTVVARLSDPSLDTKGKIETLTSVRDNIESWCSGGSYSVFLEKLIDVFLGLLDGPPVFTSTSSEQRIRNCVLEILHRLPITDPEKTEKYAQRIVDKCLDIVRVDNEDNAVLCLKIIMDFERYHIKALHDRAQPFLDLIMELFDGMQQTVRDTFDSPQASDNNGDSVVTNSPRPGSPVASQTSGVGAEEQQTTRTLTKGMNSFKVVAECPIIVVSIFQAYKTLLPKNVPQFTPRIQAALKLQAGPQQRAHESAAAKATIFHKLRP
ncbi:hypothetical protein AMS68_007695 [Peltaster fructicola]|uniref:Uncharacterized protein n=1 Tax=Peltaster fructicola TaxID=286661 RepID=A0A6H0Y5R3_9PEZI|nr:hypothetical protein AMS68_007695 [Peltaster fructicola]